MAQRRKNPNNTGVIFLRNLPIDVRDNFKAWCAKRGKSMTRVFIEFMKEKTKHIKDE